MRKNKRMPALIIGHGNPNVLAVMPPGGKIDFFNDHLLAGSISMASLICA